MTFTQEDMENFAKYYMGECVSSMTPLDVEEELVKWVEIRDNRRNRILTT